MILPLIFRFIARPAADASPLSWRIEAWAQDFQEEFMALEFGESDVLGVALATQGTHIFIPWHIQGLNEDFRHGWHISRESC